MQIVLKNVLALKSVTDILVAQSSKLSAEMSAVKNALEQVTNRLDLLNKTVATKDKNSDEGDISKKDRVC